MNLNEAREIADTLCYLLRPACERIEAAGSVRREKPDVGDIEVVCLPVSGTNLLGEPAGNRLDAEIAVAMGHEPRLGWDGEKKRRGAKYKRLRWAGEIGIDLFTADERNYGNILAIRTGNADFSHYLVTQRWRGGLMPDDLIQRGGYLWRVLDMANPAEDDTNLARIDCPTEEAYFAALGVHSIPSPRERDVSCIARLRKAIA
jgi:hypothetical protein